MLAYTNPFLVLCPTGAHLEGTVHGEPVFGEGGADCQPEEAALPDACHAGGGHRQPAAVRGQHVLCLYPSPSAFGLYLRFGADIADYFAGHIGVRNIYIGEVFGDTSQRYARVEALRDDVPYGEFQFSPVNHGIEQPDSRE